MAGEQHPGRFLNEISQYQPMYSGVAPRPYQAFDFSSMLGQGAASQFGGMLMQPFLTQMMGQVGMVPGQFQPTMNLFDRMQAQQFFGEQQKSMRQAATADRFTTSKQMEGLFQMMGVPVGLEQQKFIRQASEGLSQAAPMLAAMMPDTWDAMHGLRGSATVMAQQFHLGGRHQIDPITGQIGMRGDSAGQLAKDVFGELFGPGKDVTQMRGLGAGRVGQMYEELSRRGYIGSSSKQEAMRELGMNEKDLEAPEAQQQLRNFDAKKVASKLKDLSGAVSAMRDIFGDMGKPNAPMSELINGLNALTQGGLASMSGQQLEQTVRKTAVLARNSGMGIDAMMGLMAGAAQRADQMGLDRQFVMGATQGAVSFGQAFRALGQGDVAAFKRMDAEGMTVMDQNLRLNAANSPMANMLGATARAVQSGMTTKDSDAERLMRAVRSGQKSFTSVAGKEVDISTMAQSPEQFIQMLQASGLTAAHAGQLLGATQANQEYVVKEDLGISNFVRKSQGAVDVDPVLRATAAMSINPALAAAGFNERESEALTGKMSEAVRETLRGMDPRDRDKDPRRRNMLLAVKMRDSMGEDAYMRLGKSEEERQRSLLGMAEATVTNLDETVAGDPALSAYKNHRNLLDAHRETLLRQADNQSATAQFEASVQSAFSGLGQMGPMRRLAESLVNANSDTGVGDILGSFFGGVKQSDINNAMGPLAKQLQDEHKKLQAIAQGEGEFSGKSVEERQALLADSQRKIQQVLGGKDPSQLLEIARKRGLKGPDADKQLIRQVMSGEITGKDADEIREMAGLTTMAEQGLDMYTGGGPSDRQQKLAMQAGEGLAEMLRTMPEKMDEKQRAAFNEQVKVAMSRQAKLVSDALGDDKFMQHLGEGGLDLVKGIRDRQAGLQKLAKEAGGTVEELLAGTKGTKEQQEAARKMVGSQQKAMEDLQERAGRTTGPETKMSDEEMADLHRLQRTETATAEDTAGALSSVLGVEDKEMQGASGQKLKQLLGSTSRRTAVMGALEGREKLLDLARRDGMVKAGEAVSPAKMKEIMEKYKGSHPDLVSQLEKGGLGELLSSGKTVGIEELTRAIEQTPGGDEDKGKAAPPPKEEDKRLTIEGTLTVKQDGTAEVSGTGQRGGAQPPGGR